MTVLRAGFGRADITPQIGCRLMGYGNRTHGATGVHDRLFARALVVADEGGCWALVACDLRCMNAESVREARQAVERRLAIPASNLFIATTHTHSGPHDRDAENWQRPLGELVADAVQNAYEALQPAQLGSGFGMLYGYSINRRWIDRPVDPGVAVVRVDTAEGKPLGLITSFGCHPVVLGYDNYLISADWPGTACRQIEATLGDDATCLFLQGGGGNVNPVVAGVRRQIQSGRPVVSIGNISAYYGSPAADDAYNVGDRHGGTFEEVAELGNAFAEEVLHVHRGVQCRAPDEPIWSEQLVLDSTLDEPALGAPVDTPQVATAPAAPIAAEIMLLAIGDILLLGQPGEVFSETALSLRTHLARTGLSYAHYSGPRQRMVKLFA